MIQGYLNDLYKGSVNADEDGNYRGTGIGAALLKPFVDEQSIESGKQQGAVKRTITAAGENPADYNLGAGATVYDAQGAIATQRRDRADAKDQKNHERSMALPTAQLDLQREQGKQTYQLALMAQKDTAQARIDALNQQMRQDRRADQRHNESMERLDRADRRKAISGMAGGLAALAAAFAM